MLSGKKGKLFESSIAQSYIQSIRNAQNYIYIENQYFMGSSYEWKYDSGVPCQHTIPAEIVAKIRNKMLAGWNEQRDMNEIAIGVLYFGRSKQSDMLF